MTNQVLEALKNRRSIRKYKIEQIKDEELNAVLEAGTYAPTGTGTQSPLMVVVQDKGTIARLSKMNAAFTADPDGDPFYGAPTVVIVLADSTNRNGFADGCLVMGNLMNAAYSIGLGSCWINRAREMFDTAEGRKMLRGWGVEDKYVGVGSCILGYADCPHPEAKPRKEGYVIRT